MRTKNKAAMVTIECGHPGCEKSQTLRRSRVTRCDGYMCRHEHGPGEGPPPGLVREIVPAAAGGFTGWRDIVVDEEGRASLERARHLALLGLAQTVPQERVVSLLQALVGPAGRGLNNLLTINQMSTAVLLGRDGTPVVELPNVAAAMCSMLDQGHQGGVVLRTFTKQTAYVTSGGRAIPVKEVRGWVIGAGVLHPLSAAETRVAHCTDAETGRPLPQERGVLFLDAWPVNPG